MILKHLSLLNYKNFEQKSFDFGSKINCIVGDNGKGKTNVLDAIYHLSFCKSYFNPISAQNIRHQEDFFVIIGTYNQDEKEEAKQVAFPSPTQLLCLTSAGYFTLSCLTL